MVLCPPSTVRGFLVLARVAASCPAQANQGRASLAVLLLTDQPSANVLLGVSAQHVAQQEGSDDEKDDIGRSTFREQWTGYAAANDPRRLPNVLPPRTSWQMWEQHFRSPRSVPAELVSCNMSSSPPMGRKWQELGRKRRMEKQTEDLRTSFYTFLALAEAKSGSIALKGRSRRTQWQVSLPRLRLRRRRREEP